jgi:hypothetical protein
MAGFSNHLAQALINASLRGIAYSTPSVANLYLALFTADPTDANITSNEVSGAWYARQQTGSWAAPTGSTSANLAAITFPAVTGSSVTVTHIGIYDASSGGNLLYSQAMSVSKTLAVNDVLVFAIGDIDIDLQ